MRNWKAELFKKELEIIDYVNNKMLNEHLAQVFVKSPSGIPFIVKRISNWNIDKKQFRLTDLNDKFWGEYEGLDEVAEIIARA